MKKLAALALVPAAVAALAVPAGASSTTTWTHLTVRCQGGRYDTVTLKWQAGYAVDGWATNSCRHQYLAVRFCDPPDGDSPKCFERDLAPATKGNLGWLDARVLAVLESQPNCDPISETCED